MHQPSRSARPSAILPIPSDLKPNRHVRLTVETGPLAGTVIHLKRDEPTLIGSNADNHICIVEAGVIDHHAVVKALKGTGFGIKAHGDVRVNGSAVQASPLADGDVIEIGTTRIAFGIIQARGLPSISGYRIMDQLGKGGMGVVYRAEQVSLNRQVALKVLKQEQTSDPVFIAKFVAEARAAAKLQHPNVVSVFDVENENGTYYIAMELMHEGSCEDWLKQNGVMQVDRALQVIADAAAGLAYAESLGIVHRDIKPDNLMLDQHGAIKIADLGLASHSSDSSDARAIGTPHFMAPEQVLNQDLDHRTDLYALGCTFYRLVTGKTPFRGQTVKDILRAQVKEQPELASRANPEVPNEIAQIIQRMMAKEPRDRYQTSNELLEELQELLQPPQKRGLWITMAVVAVLVATSAIGWAVTRPSKTIEIEKRYDDPLTQELADKLKIQKGITKQNTATIAVLRMRLSGLQDEQLATALEQIAAEHPDTVAAQEATELVATIRSEMEERKRQEAQRRSRIAEHIAMVRQATIKPIDAHDYQRAIQALEVKAPVDIAADTVLVDGVGKLRADVVELAKQRIRNLLAPLSDQKITGDEDKLLAAMERLEVGLNPETRWPTETIGEVNEAKQAILSARDSIATLQELRRASAWKTYHNMLSDQASFRSPLANNDFATMSSSIDAFAATASGEPVLRAQGLAEVSKSAKAFAAALEQAIASGSIMIPIEGEDLKVVAWSRAKNDFTVKLSNRKQTTIAGASLTVAQWLGLADQVLEGPPGGRESFLGLLVINKHCIAAAEYLSNLSITSDETGLAAQAYPFSADVFEQLLAKMQTSTANWSKALNHELQAGKRLAAGLRALSEKRNTAAAGHIDKLLSAHPHSLVVAVLP